MAWWSGGSSLKRLLHNARSFEQERERKLLNAYARGYKKYRQRQKERKRRKR
jgi:predicted secreted protein